MESHPHLDRPLAALAASGLALPRGPAWEAFLEELDRQVGGGQEPARYRSLVDHLREAVFQIDREGAWSFLNPAWETMTGFPVAESLGTPFLGHMHPVDQARYLNMLTGAMDAAEDTIRGEFRSLKGQALFGRALLLPRALRYRTGLPVPRYRNSSIPPRWWPISDRFLVR